MAKDFKSKNIMPNIITIPESDQETHPEEKNTPVPEKRSGRGRPKTKDVENTCKKFNLAIPIELYDRWKEVSILWGGNFTLFVEQTIRKDLENNGTAYKETANILQGNSK